MLRLINKFSPPESWKIPVILVLGTFCGIIVLTLRISNAFSYLSDDPSACVNCHVMAPQFATWQTSSHGRVTVCNDCHVPHDNVFRKYVFKAQDGLRHSTMFTFRLEPQVIHIKEAGIAVVQENCIRCHDGLVDRIGASSVTGPTSTHGQGLLCWQCHRETPHGRVNSLSSAPFARVPRLSKTTPEWMDPFLTLKKP